jgi:hypothetical protein
MALVRTNVTLPEDVLAQVDAVAGPRGRSAYIADVVARQVRRDHGRKVFAELAGALKDSTSWGRDEDEILANLRALRAEWDRPWIWETPDDLSPGHDGPDRPRTRRGRRTGAARGAVRPAR